MTRVNFESDLLRSGEVAVLSAWHIEAHSGPGEKRNLLFHLACRPDGSRIPSLERKDGELFVGGPLVSKLSEEDRRSILHDHLEAMITRELTQRGFLREGGGFSAQLVAWVELMG